MADSDECTEDLLKHLAHRRRRLEDPEVRNDLVLRGALEGEIEATAVELRSRGYCESCLSLEVERRLRESPPEESERPAPPGPDPRPRDVALEHSRHQHPVGHGFFHTGSIRVRGSNERFEYVYDIGAKKTRELLAPQIDDYVRSLGEGKIDMLALSHLHSDHVSGLDQLLLRRPVETVVLPYLDPGERLLVVGALLSRNRCDVDASRFVADPRDWLRQRGVTQVLTVTSDAELESPELPGPEDLPSAGAGAALRLSRGRTDVRGALGARLGMDDCIAHETPLAVARGTVALWEFKFFCWNNAAIRDQMAVRVAKLRRDVTGRPSDGFQAAWLVEALRSASTRAQLVQWYREVVGRRNGLNWSSLCMRSAPILGSARAMSAPARTANDGVDQALRARRGRYAAWLGVGDAELADEAVADQFLAHYGAGQERVDIACMALPHHGSGRNHNLRALSALDPEVLFAACPTPRAGHKQRHPDPVVERQILKWRGQPLLRVDEADESGLHESFVVAGA